LTLLHTILLGLVVSGFAVIVYATVASQELSQLNYELRLRADDVQERAFAMPLHAGRGDRTGDSRRIVPGVADRNERLGAVFADRIEGSAISAQLVQGPGNVLLRTSDLDQPIPLPVGFAESVSAMESQTTTIKVEGEAMQVLGLRLGAGRFSDGLMLVVATSLAPVESTLATWRLTLSVVVLGTIGLAAAIAWFMATRALRPVDQMAGAARAIGEAADFNRRLPEPDQTDELARLAQTFNKMLDQLEMAHATQRRFLTDASHELRSPLTAIATNLAVLRGGGAPPSDDREHQEMLRAAAQEADRLSRLVADLLTLARTDAGQAPHRRRLDLGAIVLDVYQQQLSLASGVALGLGDWEQVEVEADADRLKQAVLNLVDNALRYTPAGGAVTLELRRHDNEAAVVVRDTGIGVPPEHQERIFERFYRVDQPRGRQSGGTGLGLAIACEIAIAHGGRIELASDSGVGSTFSLIVPALPEPAALVVPVARRSARLEPQPVA
jgi:signal transduction histidine kinase